MRDAAALCTALSTTMWNLTTMLPAKISSTMIWDGSTVPPSPSEAAIATENAASNSSRAGLPASTAATSTPSNVTSDSTFTISTTASGSAAAAAAASAKAAAADSAVYAGGGGGGDGGSSGTQVRP